MVTRMHFFDINPSMLTDCLAINNHICTILNKFDTEHEVSFDVLLPFLFNGISRIEALQLSKEMTLHRYLVDSYNKKEDTYKTILSKMTNDLCQPVSYDEYQLINSKYRVLRNNDIVASYLHSTERVYYRFDMIKRLNVDYKMKLMMLNTTKKFSAFLLFDDDVYDLEEDIDNNKKTILYQFLQNGNTIEDAIGKMNLLLEGYPEPFKQYAHSFKFVYE